jgi:hypothetical protein
MTKTLEQILNLYGSDKSTKHYYHTIYEPYFEKIRYDKINILEVGILDGKSMLAWLEYFPNAEIYGIDIFTRTRSADIPALKRKRTHWALCDSTLMIAQSTIKRKWPDVKFDIILDDGLHTLKGQAKTFMNLIPLLKENGTYFIEDICAVDKLQQERCDPHHPAFSPWWANWFNRHEKHFNGIQMNFLLNALEDSGHKITHYDNRVMTAEPDSYVIAIKK